MLPRTLPLCPLREPGHKVSPRLLFLLAVNRDTFISCRICRGPFFLTFSCPFFYFFLAVCFERAESPLPPTLPPPGYVYRLLFKACNIPHNLIIHSGVLLFLPFFQSLVPLLAIHVLTSYSLVLNVFFQANRFFEWCPDFSRAYLHSVVFILFLAIKSCGPELCKSLLSSFPKLSSHVDPLVLLCLVVLNTRKSYASLLLPHSSVV